MVKPVLVVFARAPRLGCVKRRLAAGIGQVPALRFYRNQLAATLREFSHLRGWEKILAITPDGSFLNHSPSWRVIGQGQGDLGRRMQNIFRKFPNRRVVLVGADIPGLTAADIRAAAHGEIVFGPAADGGFYLIAMRRRRPAQAFANVRWSGPHALADTLKNFATYNIAFGRKLHDIDTAADYFRCSINRGMSSTRLQGRCRESS